MPDCEKARGLIDWIYWSQTNPDALDLATKYQTSLFDTHHHHTVETGFWTRWR